MSWVIRFFLFLCLLIIVATAIYGALDWYSARYVAEHAQSLGYYSNAGQYLNFVVGIPLAITAALIGAFVSYHVGHFTQTKDDFSILKFVDDASAPVFSAHSRVAREMAAISLTGMHVHDFINRIAAERLQDKFDGDYWQEIDKIKQDEAVNFRNMTEEIKRPVLAICEQYSALASQMNGTMFLKARSARKRRQLPADYLASMVPTSLEGADRDLIGNSTLQTMTDALSWMVENRGADDMLRSYHYLPQEWFLYISYVGMILYSPEVKLKTPVTLRDGQIVTKYAINIAGALLVSLYESLPDKDDMLQAFRKLPMELPAIASNYLTTSGPKMSDMAAEWLQVSIKEIVNEPRKLIVLYTDNNAFYFDPKLHGSMKNWE